MSYLHVYPSLTFFHIFCGWNYFQERGWKLGQSKLKYVNKRYILLDVDRKEMCISILPRIV